MALDLSRRNLFKVAGGLSVASLLGFSDQEIARAASSPSTVRFANWPLYLDYNKNTKTFPTLIDFTKKPVSQSNIWKLLMTTTPLPQR